MTTKMAAIEKIVAEIATVDNPYYRTGQDGDYLCCHFCEAEVMYFEDFIHEDNCLWMRSKEALKGVTNG